MNAASTSTAAAPRGRADPTAATPSTTARPVRAADAGCAARLRGRTDHRVPATSDAAPSRACRQSRDSVVAHAAHSSRCRSTFARLASFAVVVERQFVFAVMRHDSPRNGSQGRPQLLHRAKDAVLRRAGAETERPADLVDRSAFVVPQRERRALERAEGRQRPPHPRARISALCASRSGPGSVDRPAARRPRPGSRRASDRAAPASSASDPPSSSRRCDRATCRSSPAIRTARAACRREESSPAPHPRHPAHSRSSGTPAGRHCGCDARRARETPRCRPGGHGPGRLPPRSRPSHPA